MYPFLGGRGRENTLDWVFPSGARIEFSHLQHLKDAVAHRSKQYCGLFFDEAALFEEGQFWNLFSRNRSVCGIPPFTRMVTNPPSPKDPKQQWVRRLLDWWIGDDGFPIPERCGKVRWFVRSGDSLVWNDRDKLLKEFGPLNPPVSITFIPSKLSDNRILMQKDPAYLAKLMALPLVERKMLMDGNWNVTASAGMYFRRSWFEVVDAAPAGVKWVRGWDKAATKPSPQNPDPDWTAGVKYCRKDGEFFIGHIERFRESPAGVERRIQNIAKSDGRNTKIVMWQDPGQAGKVEVDHYVRLLNGFTVKVHRASKDKITYAEPVSAQAERGNIKIVRGPWNEQFFDEVEAFPEGGHDDQIDGLNVAHLELAQVNLDRIRSLAKW